MASHVYGCDFWDARTAGCQGAGEMVRALALWLPLQATAKTASKRHTHLALDSLQCLTAHSQAQAH